MIGDCDGYNPRFAGTAFENGDKCNGCFIDEGGRRYWIAVDSNGDEYETLEMPCVRIDLTSAEHWTVIIPKGARS